MSAPKGNQFYKLVQGPTGRPPIYSDANEIWKKAIQYFEWVEKHPLYERKAFGTGRQIDVPKMRAMTENAFCLFAGISHDTFRRWKSNESDSKDFCVVSNRIAAIIYQQKFEGAAADFLNANIIGRELGLVDKKEIEQKGETVIRIIDDPGL